MKRQLIFTLGIIFFLSTFVHAENVLTRINKIDAQDAVELYCSFSNIPSYRSTSREKRIDFILEDTVLADDFLFFKADDRIVKILSQHKNNKTVLSFFFRYPPQKFTVSPNTDENKLIVRILLGNSYSSALSNLSSKLSGLTVVDRKAKDYSNPLIASPYAADWRSFFKLYEAKYHITVPVQFSMPPFPIIQFLLPNRKKNIEFLNEEIVQFGHQHLWHSIPPILLDQMATESDPERKKMLALTYGEVLTRYGQFADAYKQLYLLSTEYPEEDIGIIARYLLYLLEAKLRDPFIADYELRKLKPVMTTANPLTPYFRITQIETALATAQYSRMKELLALDDVGYPEQLEIIRDLRQADYWSGTDDTIKAYVGYQLLEKQSILENKRFSLNGYCDTLYDQKQYVEASNCYNLLASYIDDKEKLGLINFRKYMAELHIKKPSQMIDFFSRIENTYSGTDAGYRGAMKKTDLRFLTEQDWTDKALLHYKAFAEKGISRESREEASFKIALLYRLKNQNIRCVNHTMKFLRDFRGGELHSEAQALLIEIFPLVLQEYVSKKKYVDALVLAKQNRKLFEKNWVSIAILADLAASYNALGLYDEAFKIYQYLITISSEDQKEQYYLPIIQAAFHHGSYYVVEDFADQYSFRYPNGKDQREIVKIRIQSLLAEQNYHKAIELLPKEIPEEEEFSLLAATLYFHENMFNKVISILDRPLMISKAKWNRYTFMLAESYYQVQQQDKGITFFQKIEKTSSHYGQALYRRAEYLLQHDKKEQALKLYRELAETKENTQWGNLAQKAVEFLTTFNTEKL